MKFRILYNFLLLISIFFVPFWITLFLILLGIVYFNNFYEAVFFALISDFYFGVEEARYLNTEFLFTVIVTLLLLISIFLKTRLLQK